MQATCRFPMDQPARPPGPPAFPARAPCATASWPAATSILAPRAAQNRGVLRDEHILPDDRSDPVDFPHQSHGQPFGMDPSRDPAACQDGRDAGPPSPGKKKGPGFLPGPVGGDDLLSRALDAVPSALAVLTSLFGMGRGGTRRFRHHVPRAPDRTPSTRAGNTEHSFRGKPRAISTARLCRRRLYTCGLSTSSSSTALMEASSSGEFRT